MSKHCGQECSACNNGKPHLTEQERQVRAAGIHEAALLHQLKAVNKALEVAGDMVGLDDVRKNQARRRILLSISQELQAELIAIAPDSREAGQ